MIFQNPRGKMCDYLKICVMRRGLLGTVVKRAAALKLILYK